MSPLLRIITFCVSIIMSLLRVITIITYYYVFETGQLADETQFAHSPVHGSRSVHGVSWPTVKCMVQERHKDA